MKAPDIIRDPIPTIPEEPMTRPSGIRSLAPNAKPIPEEIKGMVRRVLETKKGGVAIRKISSNPTVINDCLRLVPGMDTPVMHVSRVAYTDGDVTTATEDRSLPESLKKTYSLSAFRKSEEPMEIIFTVRNKIEDADYIAVTSHTNDHVNGRKVFTLNSIAVFAREPGVVYDFIRTLREDSEEPSE